MFTIKQRLLKINERNMEGGGGDSCERLFLRENNNIDDVIIKTLIVCKNYV